MVAFEYAMPGTRSAAGDEQTRRAKLRIAKWMALVVPQGISAAFYVGDVATEMLTVGFVAHTILEGLVTLALICGVVLGSLEIRRIVRRSHRSDKDLRRAVASFSSLVRKRFSEWSLTSAEQEVAMLLLKGFDIAEIAAFRKTAQGTVRAQLSRIYEKSGHTSCGGLVSSFLDVLIEMPVSATQGRDRANP